MVESIGEYILEQSVSVRAVPELIVGWAGAVVEFFCKAGLHTSGKTMLEYISMQNSIKIYHVVHEL